MTTDTSPQATVFDVGHNCTTNFHKEERMRVRKTRPMSACDQVLGYASRLWASSTRLTFAHHSAQSPEVRSKIAATIAMVNEDAEATAERLFEQSKLVNQVARDAGSDYHAEELQTVGAVGERLLEHAQVLSGRAALLCETLLAVPTDYAERKHLEKAKRDIIKVLVQADRALEKANNGFASATRQALVALRSVENDLSIEEATEQEDARWQ
jgi:hypothetical protein